MTFEDMTRLFLRSREMGDTGAKKRARPNTVKWYRWGLEQFVSFMREQGLVKYEDIKRLHVLDFLKSVMDSGMSETSRLMLYRILRTLFIWVERDEDCNIESLHSWRRCLPAIPRSQNRKFIPTEKTLKQFLNGFPTSTRHGYRDYVAMSLMLETGARIGELCYLKMDGLKLAEKIVLIPEEGKTGTRLVRISSEMARILKGWLRFRQGFARCDYVFVNQMGQQCSSNTFDQSFRKNRMRLGIKGITPHVSRHAFCTYFLRNGGELSKMMLMTGHTDYETAKGYMHMAEVTGDELQAAIEQHSPLKSIVRVRT